MISTIILVKSYLITNMDDVKYQAKSSYGDNWFRIKKGIYDHWAGVIGLINFMIGIILQIIGMSINIDPVDSNLFILDHVIYILVFVVLLFIITYFFVCYLPKKSFLKNVLPQIRDNIENNLYILEHDGLDKAHEGKDVGETFKENNLREVKKRLESLACLLYFKRKKDETDKDFLIRLKNKYYSGLNFQLINKFKKKVKSCLNFLYLRLKNISLLKTIKFLLACITIIAAWYTYQYMKPIKFLPKINRYFKYDGISGIHSTCSKSGFNNLFKMKKNDEGLSKLFDKIKERNVFSNTSVHSQEMQKILSYLKSKLSEEDYNIFSNTVKELRHVYTEFLFENSSNYDIENLKIYVNRKESGNSYDTNSIKYSNGQESKSPRYIEMYIDNNDNNTFLVKKLSSNQIFKIEYVCRYYFKNKKPRLIDLNDIFFEYEKDKNDILPDNSLLGTIVFVSVLFIFILCRGEFELT